MDTDNKNRLEAMVAALAGTEAIINRFSHIVRQDWTGDDSVKDYSETAAKILGKDRDSITETEESSNDETDERMNLSLTRLKEDALSCRRCRLCETRKTVVFGEGCESRPLVMVIGEGPGETEDNTGRPFVGKAGQFLDQWLASISLSRERNVYISNIVKCRPPMNRDPQLDEREICKPFIDQQIALIKPRTILCLGKPASSIMTGKLDFSMGQLRGQFSMYKGIPMLCTYHPSAVLRDLTLKRPVWEDLKKLAKFLNLDLVTK